MPREERRPTPQAIDDAAFAIVGHFCSADATIRNAWRELAPSLQTVVLEQLRAFMKRRLERADEEAEIRILGTIRQAVEASRKDRRG